MAAINEDFGAWRLDVSRRVLMHTSYPPYEIDLDEIKTAPMVLDWIFQVEEKEWGGDAEIADFVRAIRYLFGRSFCGSGRNHPLDIKAALCTFGVT